MNKITEQIYLGDVSGATNLYMLRANGITHILTVAAGMRPLFPFEFTYKCFEVLDMPTQSLMHTFLPGIEFMRDAVRSGGKVLVHCFAGVSRSASMVIAYLIKEHGMGCQQAFEYCRSKRMIIFPNPGF